MGGERADLRNVGDDFQREYETACRLARAVESELHEKVKRALSEVDDGFLFRYTWEPSRIKSIESLQRKAARFGWTPMEALDRAADFLGLRLVCSNLQDARRVADRLETILRADHLKVQRNNIDRLKQDGYRATHLSLPYPIRLGGDGRDVRTEIQIRSMLQDAWADLSRREVYVSDVPVPKAVNRQMRNLAVLLAKADRIADTIRRQLSRRRRGKPPHAGKSLTASALAYLYEQAFREQPSEYVVQSLLTDVAGLSIRADGLEALLNDAEFRARLREAHTRALDYEYDPDPVLVMRWCLHAIAHGTASAIALARRDGAAEARSIAAVARREFLSDLPDSIDGFLSSLETHEKDDDPASDIKNWAAGLGALERCSVCSTATVNAETFAEGVVRHYRLRGNRADAMREEIETAVVDSGVETGSVCSYCDYQLGKD